jgi:hypothetical protein
MKARIPTMVIHVDVVIGVEWWGLSAPLASGKGVGLLGHGFGTARPRPSPFLRPFPPPSETCSCNGVCGSGHPFLIASGARSAHA